MMHGTGVLLLAAVGGYWVLERAAREKGQLKRVGQLLGAVIIVVSLIGVVCTISCLAGGRTGLLGGSCPLMGKKAGRSYWPSTMKTPASTTVPSQ